jgi:hypothetical protein
MIRGLALMGLVVACSSNSPTTPAPDMAVGACSDACRRLIQCGIGCNQYEQYGYAGSYAYYCSYDQSQFGMPYTGMTPYGYDHVYELIPDYQKCMVDCGAYVPTADRDKIVSCVIAASSCSNAFACGM